MHICFISREYPPETGWGGIGTYTYNISHALADMGHEVHVIAQAVENARDYSDEIVHVHRILPKSISSPLFGNVLDSLMGSFQVNKRLKSIDVKFDIVEAPEWVAEGFFKSFSKRVPLITRFHTPLFLINKLHNKKMGYSLRTIDLLEKIQTKNSYALTSPTAALAKIVSDHWNINPSPIKVIPNGINVGKIRSMKIEKNSIDSDYIVYVGRLEPRKGVHILAKALTGIFRQYPNLKMVFIGKDMAFGTGTMKDFILDVNREYHENIIFTGFVPDEEKYSLIKYCRLVVLPSLWENFPYTCLESMALGKTIIATRGSGYDEIIEDGRSGFLVGASNHLMLQNKIIECLDDIKKISRVEQIVRERVEVFDIQKVSMQSYQYYEKLLNNYFKNNEY